MRFQQEEGRRAARDIMLLERKSSCARLVILSWTKSTVSEILWIFSADSSAIEMPNAASIS